MPEVSRPTGNVFLDTIHPEIPEPRLPPPTSQINGSAAGATIPDGVSNTDAPTNAERADALFPFFDGINETLAANPISQDGLTEYLFPGALPTLEPEFDANGNPINVDADGNPLPPGQLFANVVDIPPNPNDLPVEDFFGFHSSHQLQYVLQFGEEIEGTDGARLATFEQDGNRFDVVAIPGERRIFVLQQLTKADLAIIAPETGQALAAAISSDAIPSALRTQIESAIGAQSGQAATDALSDLIDDANAQIEGFFNTSGAGNFSAAQIEEFKAAFTDQIDNIQTRAEQSSFFDLIEIRSRIDAIVRRAERANEFFIVVQTPPSPLGDGASGLITNVNAPVGDDGSQAGLRSAFDTFIAQETRLRDLDNQRLQLAQTGLLNGGRALDGPSLIAIFQLNYNLTREAEVNAETEELNQQNALLRVYADIQQLVNDALREFGTGEDGAEEERNILGRESDTDNLNNLSERERLLISFVERGTRNNSTVDHPIEALRNINRPTLDLVQSDDGTLNRFSQNELNIFASQLADTVTQINQESQILTNEISSLNRERNRNFDLANNALRRLNDALLNISRT
ncbi:hypothetical protein [Cognatiyoonia sp. IB215182]|uniref:hypothetical protein n=1 Tax=Cognatiyoonia sp. IB215182 TaxID=3097353 RepID=UPI002A1512B8|nr:hypothetical protein [Cognatiyoonia sp. IB215182]MDX8355156.1 hypothetical protein [Cognatiyoonia sp. IB215182]